MDMEKLFLEGKIAVYCKTNEEVQEFLQTLPEFNISPLWYKEDNYEVCFMCFDGQIIRSEKVLLQDAIRNGSFPIKELNAIINFDEFINNYNQQYKCSEALLSDLDAILEGTYKIDN